MEAEEYYNKIRIQLGTQALLSYQIDGCELYGKDAICKMLEDYHQAKLNLLTIPVASKQRELLIDFLDDVLMCQNEGANIVDRDKYVDGYLRN